ncbi:MAG: SUMF1/EgtB/PvdO family nonheme iron enzyme [Chloroflexota bacterium]
MLAPNLHPQQQNRQSQKKPRPSPAMTEATNRPQQAVPPTSTPEPTAIPPTPVPAQVIFELAAAQQTLPEDLFAQVSYFAYVDFTDGGLSPCEVMDEDGVDSDIATDFSTFRSQSDEMSEEERPFELYQQLTIRTCHWQPGDEIEIELRKPDGESIQTSVTYGAPSVADADSIYLTRDDFLNQLVYLDDSLEMDELDINFTSALEDMPGDYLLQVSGAGRVQEIRFTISAPDGPRAYAIRSFRETIGWELVNFAPNETIRFIAYSQPPCPSGEPVYDISFQYANLCLQAWQTWTVNGNGRLRIDLPPDTVSNSLYFIAAPTSGSFSLFGLFDIPFTKSEAVVKTGWTPIAYTDSFHETAVAPLSPHTPVHIIGEAAGYARVQLPDESIVWVLAEALTAEIDTAIAPPDTIYLEDVAQLSSWAHIPAGSFYMGSSSFTAAYTEPAEQPEHLLNMAEFWMQRTEVSNEAYQSCVAAGVCTPPATTRSATRPDYYDNPDYANYPVIYVTHEQASAYCEWIDGRLPTEAEWERAARQPYTSTRPITCGATSPHPPQALAILPSSTILSATRPRTDYLTGITAVGLLNMHGNVWEWTADWFDENYYAASPEDNPTGPDNGSEKWREAVVGAPIWSTSALLIASPAALPTRGMTMLVSAVCA